MTLPLTILKEHTEAEDKVIEALEQKLEFLKANSNMVDDFVAINKIREADVRQPQLRWKGQATPRL